ncbi:MAG: PQQ-like beta-propeller repeat protein, partial [Chloroflexota bacterium]|nr:PQQ-like beta-propeller repeat protein [Chloroflexota bacterium]
MRRIRTLRILSSAAAIAAACGMIGGPGLGSAQSTGGWPTFHGDSARDGFTSVSGPGTSLVANQWQLPKPTVSSPAVDSAGTAYIGDNDGKVYALSPSNPVAPKWSFATGGPVEDGPTLSPDGKTLYVGSDDGMVYALNTADGTKRWAVDMAGQIHGSPLVSSDGGTLFVSNVNGTIKGIQTSNGSVLWNNAINGAIPGSLAISPDGSSLYAATAEGYMYAIADSGANAGKPQNPYYLDGAAA